MFVCVGPNAISVSMSPSNQYVMVGLASKRMMWAQVTDQVSSKLVVVSMEVMMGGRGGSGPGDIVCVDVFLGSVCG